MVSLTVATSPVGSAACASTSLTVLAAVDCGTNSCPRAPSCHVVDRPTSVQSSCPVEWSGRIDVIVSYRKLGHLRKCAMGTGRFRKAAARAMTHVVESHCTGKPDRRRRGAKCIIGPESASGRGGIRRHGRSSDRGVCMTCGALVVCKAAETQGARNR